jgi:phosphate transport system substrate-binding protein
MHRTSLAESVLAALLALLPASLDARAQTVVLAAPAAPDSYEARIVASFPTYVPAEPVSGVIRIWGHGKRTLPWMRPLVTLWADGFRRYHPQIAIRYEMHGTSSGIPALFTGIGDIAILGEEILPEAAAAFERARGYPPLGIEICTGSVDVRNFDYAQMFFVHRDNPIDHLTLAQLDAIFGAEHRRGLPVIRRWGDLGLAGEWEHQAITPYGWAIADSFGAFLETALLAGSHRWNNSLHEFVHIYRDDGTIYDHGQQILDALARDRYGIAVSNVRYAGEQVKPLAIGLAPAGPFYQATKQTLIERSYPLTRTIPAVVDRPPGMPLEPKVREFLRYLLSQEGQEAVIHDGRYLPLSSEFAAEQVRKLR